MNAEYILYYIIHIFVNVKYFCLSFLEKLEVEEVVK